MMMHVKGPPVVHPGPFQVTIGDAEAKGMDQVQSRSCHRAQPSHVSGVLGDLRLKEHNVEHEFRRTRKAKRRQALPARNSELYLRQGQPGLLAACGQGPAGS
jgi:hypothetical protein